MDRNSCYELGNITKPHGLSGGFIIHLDVDDTSIYSQIDTIFVEIGGSLVPYFFEEFTLRPNKKALAFFEGINTIEALEDLINCKVFLPLSILPKLEKGKFYFHEVVDFNVIDKNHGEIGLVSQFIEASAQTLLEIKHPTGNDILVPVIEEVVLSADLEKKQLFTNLPEGLLELYLEE